jgi:hypothetical protein
VFTPSNSAKLYEEAVTGTTGEMELRSQFARQQSRFDGNIVRVGLNYQFH